jgi:threonine dehydratase
LASDPAAASDDTTKGRGFPRRILGGMETIVAALPTLAQIRQAAHEVYAVMPATPQYAWPLLSERIGCEVWVKHENHTPVGAFKIRGGIIYFNRLRERHDITGAIGATRGNHGQSLAFNGTRTGIPVTVVVPHGNSPEKNAAMRALGAKIVEHGNDFQAALEHAGVLAADEDRHFVPSYAPELVCGVATYALELFEHAPPLDAIYAPLGLGSGLAGLLAARNGLNAATEIIAVVAEGAPAYARSVEARRIVEADAQTVADGMACRRPVAAALDVLLTHGVRCVQVSDAEIESAMRLLFSTTHNVAEGAGAAALAAAHKDFAPDRRRVGVILSGGNVDRDTYARILAGESGRF